MNYEDLTINAPELGRLMDAYPDTKNKLFAFPAQSNVSGVRHSLSWIKKAQERGWDVLLDAAAFAPTSPLDLSAFSPDFVSLSFYKIFGYPTGIGCLLVKRSSFHKLCKPWFAGGTITLSAVQFSSYFLKGDHEKFEDGTIDYLSIPAITYGLDFIQSIGMEKIHCRIQELSHSVLVALAALRHDNGAPLIKLYGPAAVENRGGTFLLNFFDVRGQQYPFQYVEEMANAHMISLRTGCFCNPGVDELNHRLSEEQLRSYFVSRDQGDYFDFIHFIGRMRGAVRISIGLATTRADIEKFVRWGKTLLNRTVTM
jgi:selenocysteine lyase/cysteine desulfurase